MAGKSNKARNRKGSANSASSLEAAVPSDAPLKDNSSTLDSSKADANGVSSKEESVDTKLDATNATSTANPSKQGEGDLHLYPVSVKTQSGEKLELQLNPGDSVMDLRQFLLDAPETCFFTCYDLMLHTKDGSVHHLEDYNEISEVADITMGGCSLEMVAGLYDDRSIRAHVHRARELLSLSTLHSSLSTSLALQHETTQNTTADSAKIVVPELDGLGFMEDVTGSLGNLLSSSSKEIKCVESIVFSSFNPPPSYRRLLGDLIYLDVVTLEGQKVCITGTTRTFYVNSSTGNTLDPRPAKTSSEATTLIGLLQKISSKFKKAFRELLERKASAHPFENVQSLLPPNSWLEEYPVPDHKRDAARAEDALNLTFGSELIGMQRDWNEELQSCREFPHSTPQERILRDRALYKVTSDFVDAAISGAIGVINRCIPPINPTDPECFHMYVHNNIFFSFAVDADVGQLSKNHSSNVKVSIDSTGSSLDSPEKASSDVSLGVGGISNSDRSDGSNSEVHDVIDVSPDVSADTQLADSEQATYASANNDLRGTKAYQEANVPGLYNLAMAIIDYRGHRVVAQSIIPGILQGDKSDSLLYGSVDNGKKICWNEAFHSKVLEAAKRLHLKEHSVLDGSGNVVKLAAPVECKGIVGSDDRHYLLDLMRVTPRDANYTGPGSRFCVLRPELVAAFCQAEAAEKSKGRSTTDGESPATTDSPAVNGGVEVSNKADAAASDFQVQIPADSDSPAINGGLEVSTDADAAASNPQSTKGEENIKDAKESNSSPAESGALCEEVLLNPNVFTEFKLAGSQEETAADEENVRKVGLYLTDVVLPKFVQDLCTLEVSPMDGQTLTEALHAHGINVRYIGKVSNMTKHLPHIWDLCVGEIIVRSAKHIVKDILRESQDQDLGSAISHFLNCFFGNCQSGGTKGSANSMQSRTQKKDQASQQASSKSSKGHARLKSAAYARKNQSPYLHINSDGLWTDIVDFAKFKYQFELPEDARLRVKKVSVFRNLCQKVGITIAARKYDLDSATPFQVSDILNLQPVVKHSVPVCSEARDLVETGKIRLAEGLLTEAFALFSEAFSILQQVTGPMHREVANCCRYLAMVLYHAGDMAGAIMQQHKELIINERCLGLDHPDTAHSYGNMALFYHGLNQTELALRHMSRTLLLLSLSCGPDHPDVAATFINVAMMYQDIGKMNIALRYLQEALKKNERLLGEEHIQTAVCYHALAIAFNCMGAYKLSLQHEKKTYDILVKQLGEEDSRTRDSQNWIKTFKMRELQVNAQKQKGQAVNAASAQKALDILKAFQSATTAGSGNAGASVNKSLSAAIIGENLPRGRGVDERAARAAAEVRKKAAARGLLVRPHGVPVQALPPLTQLLNIINSGMTPEVPNSGQSEEPKPEVDSPKENGEGDAVGNGSIAVQQDGAPIGLGTGLATLDSKKQKTKPKDTN
ncbi:clustered mitochondria protein isoform X2 [Telopea speciosissima]|uniref:clustered mitochondria protein isoform X2 n=1 Tax=Telopea speciosissima TaxID=54955 RepID=UPI001CC47261|nr:clustered mitochondria protein isoform X2 [Telopea speciosissima]